MMNYCQLKILMPKNFINWRNEKMQYRYELKFPIRKDKIHLVDIWINNQIFIKKHYQIEK